MNQFTLCTLTQYVCVCSAAIGGETGVLLEQNAQVIAQIRSNLASMKVFHLYSHPLLSTTWHSSSDALLQVFPESSGFCHKSIPSHLSGILHEQVVLKLGLFVEDFCVLLAS